MSLDLTAEALAHFLRQIEQFNTTVRSSWYELRECHEAVDGLWRDEMRRTYDRAMADLDSELGRYLGGDSERYEDFMRQKLQQLTAYLHGD